MEENGVQRHPGCRREAKAHVGNAQHHMHLRHVLADPGNGLQGGGRIATVLLHAGGDGQRQGVEEQLLWGETVLQGILVGAPGNGQLLLGGAGHALLVYGAHHNTRAIPLGQLQYFVKPWRTVFVICGVENTFAPGHLQAGLHLLPLGGIQHQRQIHVGHKALHQGFHIAHAVAAHKIHVHVQKMGIFIHLLAGNAHQAVPIVLIEKFPHFP